jgi:hypothetical protein
MLLRQFNEPPPPVSIKLAALVFQISLVLGNLALPFLLGTLLSLFDKKWAG